MDNLELWNLRWSVETSARYHDWRRSRLWFIVRTVRMTTLGGAVVVLVTALNPALLGTGPVSLIVALASILIAVVSLLDLVLNFSGSAQRHEELYRRFKELQADIERFGFEPEKHIAEWEAKAQTIRIDEPPTLWAVYASSWNQTIERYSSERKGYYRKIAWWQRLLSGFLHFTPQDFPPVTA
jgi:hypothetical protein